MKPQRSRWHSFWIGTVFVVVAALVNSFGLEKWRVFEYLEEINFDSWIRAHPDTPSPNIHIFAIDDEGYKRLFNERAPLDPLKVGELILLAEEGGAKVIGVDIDTSEWTRKEWNRIEAVKTPLVFAAADEEQCDVVWPATACRGSAELAPSAHDWDKRSETGVIRTHPGTKKSSFSDLIAIIFKSPPVRGCRGGLLPKEEDPPIEDLGGEHPAPSAYLRSVNRSASGGLEPDFTTWSVAKLPWDPESDRVERERWSKAKPVSGKAVLIGGTAKKLHDFHEGSFGLESGVALQAELVNSRLTGHPIHPLSRLEILGSDIAIGVVLLAAVTRWPLVGSPMFLPFLFLILGYLTFLTFRWSGLFLSFLTIFAGILLHKFVEFYCEHRKCPGNEGASHSQPSGERATTHGESEAPVRTSSDE